MDEIIKLRLNNRVRIPIIGFGIWQITPGKETENAVYHALKTGYRHIDGAAMYGNEEDVAKAIKKSGIPRDEIFITTKIRNDMHDDPEKAFNESLKKLNTDYVDLYMIHWPVPQRNKTWEFLERFLEEGRARAIGVGNFTVRHLNELLKTAKVIPAVDQIEYNPYRQQKDVFDFCRSEGINLVGYCPLTRGNKLNDPKLLRLADKYSKTPAQVLIRWAIQNNIVSIPKSRNPARIEENFNVFDFNLSQDDLHEMNSWNEDFIVTRDPEQMP